MTVYDGRPASELAEAIAELGGRPVTLALGPGDRPGVDLARRDLVATSPSITPDFPTTEPRLRAALRALVDARPAGDRSVPAAGIRVGPVPAAVPGPDHRRDRDEGQDHDVVADRGRPGGRSRRTRSSSAGNIGAPLVERLPELTPDHRVVDELSELQLPTLSRGTTVAVYTNVTSDHLDRHGSLEAYRRVKRRLAELVDPEGALVLNAEDPVVAGYAGLGRAPAVLYRRERPMPGGLGVVDGWVVAAGVERLPLAGGGHRGDRIGRPDHADRRAGDPRAPTTCRTPSRRSQSASLFGVEPEAIRAGGRGVHRRGASTRAGRVIDGVRFINDSQGTQPDAVIAALRAFDPPVVLIAGGRDKGIDLDDAGAGSSPSGPPRPS